MPVTPETSQPATTDSSRSTTRGPSEHKFKGSLARTLLISLWILSLLPVLVLSVVFILNYRSQMITQARNQISALAQSQAADFEQAGKDRQTALDEVAKRADTFDNLSMAINRPNDIGARTLAFSRIRDDFEVLTNSESGKLFNEFFVIRTDGVIIMASRPEWANVDLNGNEKLGDLNGANATYAISDPAPLFSSQWVVFTAKPVPSPSGATYATLVGVSTLSAQSLVFSAYNTYNTAQISLFTDANLLWRLDGTGKAVSVVQTSPVQAEALNQVLVQESSASTTSYHNFDNMLVHSYAQWIPSLNIALLVEVPESTILLPLTRVLPYAAVMIFLALVVTGAAGYYLSHRITTPLMSLTKSSQAFAEGNWMQRSKIDRNDEIGLLSASFNHMAEEISTLYQSLELQVEERTRQLRTASEVAQIATSATELGDLLQRAANLMVERFGLFNTCLYLVDETGTYATLRQTSGAVGEPLKRKGYRLAANSQSLVGWVTLNNQARVVPDTREYPFIVRDNLLPQVQSEVAIPITQGNRVVGVMHVQSADLNAFDTDNVSVLQTLANQLATAIQNIRMLQAAQDTLQGTSLLYQTSHQIVTTEDEQMVLKAAANALERSNLMTALCVRQGETLSFTMQHDPQGREIPEVGEWMNIRFSDVEAQFTNPSPQIIADLSKTPGEQTNLIAALRYLGAQTGALIPLFVSDALEGVMVIATRERNALNFANIQPFTHLAEITGTAIERLRVIDSSRSRLNELETQSGFSMDIIHETETDHLLKVVHDHVRELTGDVDFSLALFNEETGMIEMPYIYSGTETLSLQPFPLGEGLTSLLLKNRKPLLLVENTEAQARALGAKIVGEPARSWMGVPLLLQNHLIGALILQDIENENRFTEKDVSLMVALSPIIATAIRNTQLIASLRRAITALEEDRYLLNTLMTALPDKIYFKDRQSRFLRVNSAVSRQFGAQDPGAVVGKTDFDFFADEHANQAYQDEQRVMQSGESIEQVIEKETWEGQPDTWVMTTKAALRSADGDVTGLLGVSRDVSELVRVQETAKRQAHQLQTASEIAKDTSSILELDTLLARMVNLVKERFGFYHASVFLTEPNHEFAVLRESTGEAGRLMKEAHHSLALGSRSIVGQVSASGTPLVINDVSRDQFWRPNPLLPETRAELAIPLKVGERILGALDVQSNIANAFAPEDVGILQILADQLAVAVANTELFAETQKNLIQHRLLHQVTTGAASSATVDDAIFSVVQGLRAIIEDTRVAILLMNAGGERLEFRAWAGYPPEQDLSTYVISFGEGIVGSAAQERKLSYVPDTSVDPRYLQIDTTVRTELAIPLLYREELLGVLNIESDRLNAFSENDREMMGTLSGSVAAIIANARLVEQIRQQVDRQQMLYEITSKIRRSVDINTILETSATEISRVLGARRAHIQVTIGSEEQPEASKHGNGNGHNGNGNGKETHA